MNRETLPLQELVNYYLPPWELALIVVEIVKSLGNCDFLLFFKLSN